MLMTKVADILQLKLKGLTLCVREINKQSAIESSKLEDLMKIGFELVDQCCVISKNPYLQEMIVSLRPALSRTYYIALSRQEDAIRFTKSFLMS